MNRAASTVLLLAGVGMLMLGWDAYRSIGSDVSRVFTGVPTDRATWLLVGGALATASGLGGLARAAR